MTDEREEAISNEYDHVLVLFPSKYLRKEDLHGKDVTLTIGQITLRDVRMVNNTTERKVVIHFAEMQKRPEADRKVWIVPKTAALQIAAQHGNNPLKWKGKKITLFHDDTVRFGANVVGGVRVRSQVAADREPGAD